MAIQLQCSLINRLISFQGFSEATLELRNDSKIAEDIAEAITVMMNMKIEAVKVTM